MAIKCGSCDKTHLTVAQVRECYNSPANRHAGPRYVDRAVGGNKSAAGTYRRDISVRDWQSEPATDKQVAYVALLREQLTGEPAGPEQMTKQQASETITELKAALASRPAHKASTQSDAAGWDDIPEGRYATDSLTGNNDTDFWKIDRPDEGRWAGRLFVNRVIGGRDPVAVRGSTRTQALQAIRDAGPDLAMRRYGQELGHCGKCGRELTDEVSRGIGIGPVCLRGGRD